MYTFISVCVCVCVCQLFHSIYDVLVGSYLSLVREMMWMCDSQYLCTIFISTVFFSINSSIRNKPFFPFSLSLSLILSFSISFLLIFSSFFDERYAKVIRIFFCLFFFCFQKRAIRSLFHITYILSATHKTESCKRHKWNNKPSFSFYLSAAVGFVCVFFSVHFLLVFDYFYLTWFCCYTSSFFIAVAGCCFSSNERRKKTNRQEQSYNLNAEKEVWEDKLQCLNK